jgi:DNA-binding NarL/FixJ family response regulator
MIARTMNITERTVKAHLTTIFQKMEIADRLSLAIFFRDLR